MQFKDCKKLGLLTILVVASLSSNVISAMETIPDEHDLESSGSDSGSRQLPSSELRHRDRSASEAINSLRANKAPVRLEDGVRCIGLACCYCTMLCCWHAVHRARSATGDMGEYKQD